MNDRIQKLAEQAEELVCKNCPNAMDDSDEFYSQTMAKFAELIVKECASIADTAEPFLASDLIKQHFGVEETSAQAEQEAAEFIAAEDKKVASRYGYFPKLHPSEWQD